MEHIDSYYAATAHESPEHPRLQGAIDTDVCVVGGGIAGCSTALHLAERGYRVVLLEAARIGWGASGRSGGQALPGYAISQTKLRDQLGAGAARQLWDMSIEAIDLIKQRVARHQIDCDLHFGQLHVAIKERHTRELLAWQQELQRDYGYSGVRYLQRAEVRSLLATERYRGGLYDAHGCHLHPLNYTLGLARAAIDAGVRIFEHSAAITIDRTARPVVKTPSGTVTASFVALCCNAYVGNLVPELRARIMPVGTYIIATESLGETRITELMRENIAVTDMNFVLDYFRRSADHRLVFGGRVSYSGRDVFDNAHATRKRMLAVFPQLASTKIDYAWGGFVDITRTRAPDFGRLISNIYYVQGFSGHGIALTGLAGKLIAEAIAGDAERFDMFASIKHRPFPGGAWLRMPALVLAMLWFRMRDRL